MRDQDSISNLNLYEIFRIFIKGGLESWMIYSELKEPESYDWGDENGIEVDVSQRFFKARKVKIDCVLEAENEADFWSRYKLLMQTLASPGLKRVYLNQLSRSFYVYFDKMSNFEGINLKSEDICSTFTLEFTEPEPSLFEQFSYLTDKDGNYLLTTNENRLIV